MADKKLDFKIVVKDGFSSGFKKFATGLKTIGKSLFSFKTALVGVAGVAGVGLLIKKTLESIDEVAKLSRVLGVSVRELQQLKFAAGISGVSLDTLARGIRTLSKITNDFATKNLKSYESSFAKLGLTAEDLRDVQHDQVELFALVGDRLNKLSNGFEKTAIAQELFGGRASQILLVLEDGVDTFNALRREADELGLTMTQQTAKGVENANDSLLRLTSLTNALRENFVASLAPAISEFVDILKNRFKQAVEDSGGSVRDFSRRLAVSFLNAIVGVIQALEFLGNALVKFVKQQQRTALQLQFINEQMGRSSVSILKDYLKVMHILIHGSDKASDEITENNRKILEEFKKLEKPLDFSGAVETLKSFAAEIDETIGKDDFFETFGQSIDNVSTKFNGMLSEAQNFGEVIEGITEGAKKGFKKFENSILPLQDAFENITAKGLDQASDALTALVMGTKTAKEAFREFALSIVSDLTKMIIKQMLFNAISGFFGGFGGGANAGGAAGVSSSAPTGSKLSLFNKPTNAQFLADGGNVQRGRTYMVGERGVELFTPNQSGAIVPNDALGGNGVVVNQTINVSTGVAQTVRTEIAQLMPDIARASKNAVLDARRRGGTFADAFGG